MCSFKYLDSCSYLGSKQVDERCYLTIFVSLSNNVKTIFTRPISPITRKIKTSMWYHFLYDKSVNIKNKHCIVLETSRRKEELRI